MIKKVAIVSVAFFLLKLFISCSNCSEYIEENFDFNYVQISNLVKADIGFETTEENSMKPENVAFQLDLYQVLPEKGLSLSFLGLSSLKAEDCITYFFPNNDIKSIRIFNTVQFNDYEAMTDVSNLFLAQSASYLPEDDGIYSLTDIAPVLRNETKGGAEFRRLHVFLQETALNPEIQFEIRVTLENNQEISAQTNLIVIE